MRGSGCVCPIRRTREVEGRPALVAKGYAAHSHGHVGRDHSTSLHLQNVEKSNWETDLVHILNQLSRVLLFQDKKDILGNLLQHIFREENRRTDVFRKHSQNNEGVAHCLLVFIL